LIWHFDKSISGNDPPNPLQLAVVQAAGTRILSATTWPDPGSAKTDFFRKDVNAELNATTKPASKWNDGSASGLRIYDIGPSGASIAFSVGTGPLPPTGEAGSGNSSTGGAPNAGASGSVAQGGAALAGSGGVSLGGASAGGAAGSNSASAGAGSGGVVLTGGSGVGASSNAGASGSSTPPSDNADGEAGCSCSATHGSHGSAAIALGVGALVFGVGRRRRR
jgi:uncharacterized protein (TIGR03382 family)